MSYKLIDKLDQFSFQHGALLSCKQSEGDICLEIQSAVALYTNEYNDRSINTYVSPLTLRLRNAKIEELFLEGYKYYNADGTLISEVSDKPLLPDNLPEVAALCEGGYIADATVKPEEVYIEGDRFFLQLQVDAVESNDTYCMTFSFDQSAAVWERFMQKAEELYGI